MMDRLLALVVGVWLASLQISLFLSLQLLLSSAFATFAVVILSWILGSAAGVWVTSQRWNVSLLGLAGLTPYVSFGLLYFAPYNTSLIWLHGLLVTTTALYAGHFFQQERERYDRIGDLFFWENNGFVLGLVATVIGFVFYGRPLLYAAPLCGLIALLAIGFIRSQRSPIVHGT